MSHFDMVSVLLEEVLNNWFSPRRRPLLNKVAIKLRIVKGNILVVTLENNSIVTNVLIRSHQVIQDTGIGNVGGGFNEFELAQRTVVGIEIIESSERVRLRTQEQAGLRRLILWLLESG